VPRPVSARAGHRDIHRTVGEREASACRRGDDSRDRRDVHRDAGPDDNAGAGDGTPPPAL